MSRPSLLIISASVRAELTAELEAVWGAMFNGEGVGDVRTDIERLSDWFGSRAQPASVGQKLQKLDPVSISRTALAYDPPLALSFAERAVLTPEGRLALEGLRTAKPETEVTIDLLDPSLVDRYRAWACTPVREAIAAWDGKAKTVQNSALALAALVLVVTAADADRAMKLSKDLSPDAARKLKKLVLDFTKAIGRKSKLKEEVWGFPLSIASKHFYGLRREGGRVWFDANRVDETIDMCAAELRRRRRPVDPDQAIGAFEALAEGYEVASKTLDAADLPSIDRVATDALIGKLRKALEQRAQN